MISNLPRRSMCGLVVGLCAIGLLAPACSSSSDSAGGSAAPSVIATAPRTTPPLEPPTATENVTTAPPTSSAPVVPDQWTAVDPGPKCKCADGSAFQIWDRPSSPTKVVLFFEGGGACWSAETCGPGGPYTRNLTIGAPPSGRGGLFDQSNPENPVADYSMVYVPYCSGDVHIGNATTEYSPGLTIQHNGFVNANAGLDHLLETYPDVEQLIVMGSSAGSIPTPLFAALAADRLPDTKVTTLGDSSGAYPDVPEFAPLYDAWDLESVAPAWLVPEGSSVADAGAAAGLYVGAGRHNPDITFARFDYASDGVQTYFNNLVGVPPAELVSYIDQTAAQIEAGGVPLASYVAPGVDHTIIASDAFYTTEVGGVRLIDWFTALVNGEVPPDVHCVDCTPP